MIYLLITIIVLLCLTIVVLSINFRREQLSHNEKVNELHDVIVQLTLDSEQRLTQLKISDELRQKLHSAREKIDRDVLALQHDFIETLFKNNLIT